MLIVETIARIRREPVPQIAPERKHRIVRMERPQRVRPAGRQELRIGRTGRRLQQRGGMFVKAVEPFELVIKFRARLRVAVRQIDRSDRDALDSGFDVPALPIIDITGQHISDKNRLALPGEDGDAVPGPLALPDCVVSRLSDRIDGEVAVRAFQLLKAHDVRRGGGEPSQQVRKATIDVVNVESCDPHGGLRTSDCGPMRLGSCAAQPIRLTWFLTSYAGQ